MILYILSLLKVYSHVLSSLNIVSLFVSRSKTRCAPLAFTLPPVHPDKTHACTLDEGVCKISPLVFPRILIQLHIQAVGDTLYLHTISWLQICFDRGLRGIGDLLITTFPSGICQQMEKKPPQSYIYFWCNR